MMKLNKYQTRTFITLSLPFLGRFVASLLNLYRYSEFRKVYLAGILFMYLCWGSSFIWCTFTSVYFCTETNQIRKSKVLWIFLGVFPFLLVGVFMAYVLIGDSILNGICL